MSFSEERQRANEAIAAHLGEPVYIDGHELQGIAREDPADSTSLTVRVQGVAIRVDILAADATRIGVRRGMPIEWTNAAGVTRAGRVRNIEHLPSGWASIEIDL
jgi:hypothetical protein